MPSFTHQMLREIYEQPEAIHRGVPGKFCTSGGEPNW